MLAAMVKFWHRLATLNDNSLVQLCFNENGRLPEDKNDSVKTIKFFLKLTGIESISNNPNQVCSIVLYKRTFTKLRELFRNTWCKTVNQSS